MAEFDPAFDFLLTATWPNMFERRSSAPDAPTWDLRCKGCGENVPQWKAKNHHAAHGRRRAHDRERATQIARERSLRAARLARRAS